jgi:lysophospholipase L1-like esterase
MPDGAVLQPTPVPLITSAAAAAETSERLQYHKAILESLGVTDLSSLGNLSISGAVVPQPGLTVPDPNVLQGETIFQSALKIAPGANDGEDGLPLEAAGGTARLLRVTPASLERLSSTAITDGFRQDVGLSDMDLATIDSIPQPPTVGPDAALASLAIIPIDTAYWAATWINLASNTMVVFKQPCRYLTIITEKLTVGSNVTFTWERTLPPSPQQLPKPAPKPRAPTPDGLWGVTGEAGTGGLPGSRGPDGKTAPELEVWVLEMTGYPGFDLGGQRGFEGGRGQDGGDGGAGSNGRPELYDFFGFCKSGPGNGGDGGPGGRAGDGGPGGNGGHGGRLALYAPQPVIAGYSKGFYISVDGGAPGPGGIPGNPGLGGEKGQVGYYSKCPPSPDRPRYPGNSGPTGASGARGPDGQPGGHYPEASIGFHPIDADDFRRKLTEPAIMALSPNRVTQGNVVTVAGRNFSQGDIVLVEGVAAATTVVSDTMLTFEVPAVQGGQRTAQVRQADGTLSNRATLYVLPVVNSAQESGRIAPGATVTLVGSGFAPGALVRVNEQEMPDVIFIDPTRISFTLLRPSAVGGSSAGEQVSVKVVLADGTPSNEFTLVLDMFRMLVLGDSVQWGQGLAEHQKFYSLVQAGIKARMGNIGVDRTVLAHSGANIGVGDNRSLPPINGEVPTSYPTIIQQCDAFADHRETVDLILVDGGINDINVTKILNPTVSLADLRADIEKYCYRHMKVLLAKITDDFKTAKVVVTGYFPIVTEDTDLRLLETLLIAIGVRLAGPAGGWAMSRVKGNLVNLCRTFSDQSRARLRAAVQETNNSLEGGPRIFFASPVFSRQNAVFATNPWLWGINGDSSPQDNLVAGSRRTACNLNRSRTDLEICKRASIGHPNAKGAQEYAKAILAALE